MRKTIFLFAALFVVTCSAFAEENIKQNNKMAGAALTNTNLSVCDYIVKHANERELEKILIPPTKLSDKEQILPEEIADAVKLGSTEKYKIDINNDGKQEQVYVTYGGSLHLSSLYVFPLNEQNAGRIQINFKYDNKSYDEENLSSSELAFFQYQSKIYMLTKSGNSLDALFFIDSGNQGIPVCWFGQKEHSQQSLIQSMNEELCNKALKGNLQYVEFDEEPELEEGEKLQEGMYSVYPDSDGALIDIDNDGKKELIVRQEYATNCIRYILVALTPDGKKINKQLSDLLPQGGCGTEVKPFIYKGETYLDVIGNTPQSEYRQIYLLRKKSTQVVCDFKVRPRNYVLSPVEVIKKMAGNEDVWEYAISQSGTNAVDTLINGGEDINKTPNSSPLIIALRNKRTDIVEMLLKAGADPNARIKNEYFDLPLEFAASENMLETVKLFFQYGSKRNEVACNNAMMHAISNESIEMINFLLDNGVPLTDERVMDIKRNGHSKVLKALISRGLIDINRKYTDDLTSATGVLDGGGPPETRQSGTLMELAKDTYDIETLLILKEEAAKRGTNNLLRDLNTSAKEVYLMPNENIGALSQAEWSWRYWEWSKSFPKGHQPADDQTGSICMQNQYDSVIMLTGSSQDKPIKRLGEVPSGKYIFIPVLVSLAEDAELAQGLNCKALMLTVQNTMPKDLSSIYVKIDGKTIPDMKSFRQTIGCYLLNTYSGKPFAASDGYWVMLRPLAPGKHTIHFGGRLPDGFSQDVLYELIVK